MTGKLMIFWECHQKYHQHAHIIQHSDRTPPFGARRQHSDHMITNLKYNQDDDQQCWSNTDLPELGIPKFYSLNHEWFFLKIFKNPVRKNFELIRSTTIVVDSGRTLCQTTLEIYWYREYFFNSYQPFPWQYSQFIFYRTDS